MRYRSGVGGTAWLIAGVCLLPAAGFGQGTSGPFVSDSRVGYIDTAIPGTLVRLRGDAVYDINRPTRAEFIWAQAGSPFAPGPPNKEPSVDYQELTAYAEYGFLPRLSAFLEVPARWVDPTVDDNTAGLSDSNAGFKFAFLYSDDLVATFQFRTYVPSGDADRGLGNNHVSLEPALLVYSRLTDSLRLEGEFRAWVPVGGTDFAGEVLRYGVGLSWSLWECDSYRVTPVAEVVGWTVLSGKESLVEPSGLSSVQSASGDTIVNAKLGVRFDVGDRSDVYAGYGRALTGEHWYEDSVRVEYRLRF